MSFAISRIVFVVRVAAGAVFAYSGWNKLVRPVQEFQYAMEQYRVLSPLVIKTVSHTLPWIELLFGTFLILGFLRRASASVLAALCAGFLLLFITTKLLGIEVTNCGCFGEAIHLTMTQAMTADGILLLALSFLSIRREKDFELDAWIQK